MLQRQTGNENLLLLERRQSTIAVKRQIAARIANARTNLLRPPESSKELPQIRILRIRSKIVSVDKTVEQTSVRIRNPNLISSGSFRECHTNYTIVSKNYYTATSSIREESSQTHGCKSCSSMLPNGESSRAPA